MADRSGFQPCTIDDAVGRSLPSWEKSIVLSCLLLHVVDIGLDLLVLLLFFTTLQWVFFLGSAGVVLGAWVVAGLYVSFGSGGTSAPPIADSRSDRLSRFLLNFTQVQIFTETYRCTFQGGETDYFHTLRLLEALLEAAPNAFVQLYALLHWAGTSSAPEGAASLLRTSILVSFSSVGLGLAVWEQKVQFRAPCSYIMGVAVLRIFEVASRTMTLALFASVTHPLGLIWVLAIDYAVIVLVIARHRSVHLTYGLFVAIPLVLVSLEPFVWRRQDHAVPKDAYYGVRVVESILMWAVIMTSQPLVLIEVDGYPLWVATQVCALLATLGLYCLLPFVWRAARQQELSRDVDDWGDEKGEGEFSGSDYLSGNEEEGGLVSTEDDHPDDHELPPE